METNIKRAVQKISLFSVLIFFTFVFFSFSGNNTISQTSKEDLVKGSQKTIKITKDTTLEELEKIKKQMADEGLGFEYSNVEYNDNSEIISITIGYKDKNNNSGKYSVSSKNPINDIIIVSEDSSISVKSAGSSNQAFINQGSSGQDSNKNETPHDIQREAMERKMAQMEKEMEERRVKMKLRMQHQRDSLRALKNQSTGKSTYTGTSHLITKNTTNSELLELTKIYDKEDISFSYKELERNEKNEITQIYITIDNRNGSISTSSFGNGKVAIKDITVAVDKQDTVIKNAD
ncbi:MULTISPECIES: hypothetical protein [Aequorivita]|uniref:Uncharacterized protein n=1 Tax=Aequorivita iocasae TaxID=2803865 RepID=A0ABX7DTL7_9FLAO|nr:MULTISPECIES: hypothetical protein [Aequorivita]QQX76898.1 hypothetical protein JK629_01080 [Aequorivita iocasae]UCA56373.1 hypothetical protein LDL78_01090 [Aequorivita sp. F7]